jgi:hypothetical protein
MTWPKIVAEIRAAMCYAATTLDYKRFGLWQPDC